MDDRTLFLVLSNAAEGKDDEFNEWYDNVHVHEVLATPGMVSAQRYTLRETDISRAAGVPPTHKYLAVYEMQGDPDVIMGAIVEAVGTGAMHMSDSLDLASSVMTFWTPHGSKVQS
jgi:hypothetical protein